MRLKALRYTNRPLPGGRIQRYVEVLDATGAVLMTYPVGEPEVSTNGNGKVSHLTPVARPEQGRHLP